MKIIGISGRKQAGKNTAANYINGQVLKNKGMIQDFYINDSGELVIKTNDSSGNSGYGVFDATRKDESFVNYAEKELWPYIKIYHFADPLKKMAIELFDLNPKNIYGNNEGKNQPTKFYWKDMPDISDEYPDDKPMTHREFLEHFGTKIIRHIYNDAWSNYTLNKVQQEQSEIAIIPDVRFSNEIDAIKSAGGIVIRLQRDIFNSDSKSESALDKDKYDWSNFDIVIDNTSCGIEQMLSTLDTFKSYWS